MFPSHHTDVGVFAFIILASVIRKYRLFKLLDHIYIAVDISIKSVGSRNKSCAETADTDFLGCKSKCLVFCVPLFSECSEEVVKLNSKSRNFLVCDSCKCYIVICLISRSDSYTKVTLGLENNAKF